MDKKNIYVSKASRKPRRVTITIPNSTYLMLERLSSEQGRSLSNLSAYLLERAIGEPQLLHSSQSPGHTFVSMDGHLSR